MSKYFEVLVAAYVCGLALAAFFALKLNITVIAAMCSVAAILLILSWRMQRDKAILVVFAALMLCAGVWRWEQATTVSGDDISRYNGKTVEIIAIVNDIPSMVVSENGGYKVTFSASAKKVYLNGIENAASGGVLVYTTVQTKATIPEYGETLRFIAKLSSPQEYRNPGQSTYADYLRQQSITSTARTDSIKMFTPSESWLAWLGRWQQQAKLSAIENMPTEVAAVYNGVLFGGSTNIPKYIQNQFKQTGIVHILSVSGTHISLVAATVLWLCRVFGAPRRAGAFAGIIVAWLYVFLAGFVPAAVRSALMASFALMAIVLNDENNIKRSLWLAALIILLHNPLNLDNVGFLLSLSATFGIVYFFGGIADFLSKFLPRKIAQAVAFTIAAQAGMLPFAACFFNGISVIALAANILVTPVIDIVLIIGLLSAIIPWLLIKEALLVLATQGMKFAIIVNAWLATLPGGRIYFPVMSWWQVSSYYALLLFGTVKQQTFEVFGAEYGKKLILLGASTLWLAALVACFLWPVKLQIHFIDVGEGSAALVITPHHHAVLLDCGGNYKRDEDSFDVGERVVVPYLLHYGVKQLDAAIISHSHVDHAGGLPAVEGAMAVQRIITNDSRDFCVDGVDFKFTEAVSGESVNKNERMLITRVSSGGLSALITGDLGIKGEQDLLKHLENVSANILTVGHHGSKTSTSSEFIRAVRPDYAVISVGRNNRYGHPAAVVVKRIEDNGVQLFRTDVNGAIVFEANGGKWLAKPYVFE